MTTSDQSWLKRFLEHRIAYRHILEWIERTWHAGVIDDGQWSGRKKGVAQGSVMSSLLVNIYLNSSLDQWVQQWRKRSARGEVYFIR